MPIPASRPSLVERAVIKMQREQAKDQPRKASRASDIAPNGVVIAAPPSIDGARTNAFRKDLREGLRPAAEDSAPELLVIDAQRLGRKGYVIPGADPNRTANEFRTIKRPLLHNVERHGATPAASRRRIMVTSALAGEGKTFCAINLALSLANERDYSVLLVDADIARPSVPRQLGILERTGLMDALVDPSIDPATLVLPTSIDKLSILMAGRAHPKATELLASTAMKALLERITSSYPDRIILFDSPPLLATTESSVLASHMGQIVLVVETGKTRREAVKAALASLESTDGVISLVMNKSAPPGKKALLRYGGYGYGYGEA